MDEKKAKAIVKEKKDKSSKKEKKDKSSRKERNEKKAKAIRNEKKAKAIVKERTSKKKPKVNPVSGKPCGSVAGPISHGYNLRCFKTSSLAKCKASCKKDKRCNLAEWQSRTKDCCDSAIATKKACTAAGKKVRKNARWARAHGWVGYNICR